MQQFQILTRDSQIQVIRPYNPFAVGIIEEINAAKLEDQAGVLSKALLVSHLSGQLSLLSVNGIDAINETYGVIIYLLTIN